VVDSRSARQAVAEWRRRTSAGYQAVFALSLLLLGGCFVAGFLESARHFGLPPIAGDATILGRALLERGDFLPALEEFRLAGLIDPENYEANPEIALSHAVADTGALVRRDQARVSRRPGDATAHFSLGRSLLLDGDYAGSVRSLERARALDPGLRGLEGVLARAHLQSGALPEAERAYRAAIEREPSNPHWHEGIGFLLYRTGERQEARWHFERAQELRRKGGSP
jgi:Flp pilus assembly protein TadD